MTTNPETRTYWTNYGKELARMILAGEEIKSSKDFYGNTEEAEGNKKRAHNTERKILNSLMEEKANPDSMSFVDGFNKEIRIDVAERISSALRLSTNEAALIKFYAGCEDGFEPSEKLTGLGHSSYLKAKKSLEEKGLITRVPEWNKKMTHNIRWKIIIDWKDLYRNAATLIDNKPRTTRVDGKKVRIPVVKKIDHLDFDDADLLMIVKNSAEKWNKKMTHNIQENYSTQEGFNKAYNVEPKAEDGSEESFFSIKLPVVDYSSYGYDEELQF